MLKREYSRGHEHRHLLAVSGSFERRTDCNLSLSEPDVTADKPVHRAAVLHISFHCLNCFFLIGSVLVHERRFEFGLEESVRREGESL